MIQTRYLIRYSLVAGLIALFGFFIPLFIGEYEQKILTMCLINIALATSLNLINGFTGQFSMGHAGFMAVGAYSAAAVTTLILPAWSLHIGSLGWSDHLWFGMSLVFGGLMSSLAGLVVGVPSLRLKGDYLAIVTLGFGEIIRILILNFEYLGGARGLNGIPTLTNFYWLLGICFLVVMGLQRIVASIPGKQFMAVRDDETATTAMGLSTTKIKVRAFVFAAFIAGVAGGLWAHSFYSLNPESFKFDLSFQIIAMVVLGGMGSLSGSALAAVLLTVILELLRPLQQITGYDLRMVLYSMTLIVLMLTRPEGLLGQSELWNLRILKRWKSPRTQA